MSTRSPVVLQRVRREGPPERWPMPEPRQVFATSRLEQRAEEGRKGKWGGAERKSGRGEEKEKILDMAKKKRNTVPARGELCPQFFPLRRRFPRFGAASFVPPRFGSFRSALKRLTQQQRPIPVPRVPPAGSREVWKPTRRIAPRHNPRLPVRHWWA